MKRKLIFLMLLSSCLTAFAQTNQKIKLPAYRTTAEIELSALRSKTADTYTGKSNKTAVLPDDMRYPGEFEESQAALISWPYDFDQNTGQQFIDTSATWGSLWAQLADAIQQEIKVIIRVDNAADTLIINNFMLSRGTPLTKHQYVIKAGDAFWMRDFGPHGFYYGQKDSLAFIDLKYYTGRDNDNIFAKYYADSVIGKPVYTSRLNGEGGNLMTDGFGTVFFSDVYDDVNTNINIVNPPFSSPEVQDTITALFASTKNVMLKQLSCDGGTGHIDLYLKMIDEQTIMAAKYPDVITASDKKTIEDNVQILASLQSPYNRPFRIYRIPHPTSDNGTYARKTCSQMNSDARTFVNGLTLNKSFIFPSYSTPASGNQAQLDTVMDLFNRIMPGYKLVPIDARILSRLGGEIHCITMQVPAENPVHFWHPSVDGYYPVFQNKFHIIANVKNRSGVANVICNWRIKGQASFTSLNLVDSAGYFIGDIVANGLTTADEVEYYLTATTNNGKTAVKPITAPEGFYSIYFTPRTGVENESITAKNYLFNAYPNPANTQITIPFYLEQNSDVTIEVMDIAGKSLKKINSKRVGSGLNQTIINVSDLPAGIYFYSLWLNENLISTRKIVVNN